jgi:WD40 repeat protein
VTAALARALLPYPGLRPFERHEADIFFGRETQVDAMVDRLGRHHLLAVTGSSGSGKSSLVRAGLLEALETGLFAKAGSGWRFATLRPGSHPMTELARSLLVALVAPRTPDDIALRRAGLERGPLSLIEELRERPLPDGGNLLVLVDQFEELFRYRSLAGREEAEAFVALLLASANHDSVPIYVVLTMRSDFLGHCAEFDGLAEAVSDAQYLCPRLSREQIRSAIEGPAKVFGGKVESRLVARIVNDMGTDPDQLPLMQHALMRLWEQARARDPSAPQLRLDDYDAEGGIKGSLSRHADEILAEAHNMPERTETARRLFCLLTEGEGENAVRRLAEVAEVVDVTGQPLNEIAAVADPFRVPGRSLLMPASERPLTGDTVLDISHESLIRQWQTLKDWVRAEAASAEQYRDIERRARRWSGGSAGFLDGIDLDVALAWRDREKPTAPWAKRYGDDFALTMRFLDESRARRDRLAREADKEREAISRQLKERLAEAQLHQSRFLTEKAREALREEHPESAELTALAASPAEVSPPDRPLWPPAVSALADARGRDRQRAVIQGHMGAVYSAAFSPDGVRVVTASGDNTARLWDAATGALLAVLHGHTHLVRSAVFSPDGVQVVTASGDNTARLWDGATGISLAVLKGHTGSVWSAAFSPDGARVVTASGDNTARLWDAATGASFAVLRGHTSGVMGAAFSPDGARVVTASEDRTARLWDAVTGALLSVLQGHTGFVWSAAFSPDGTRIVTASDDKTARLWDAATGASLTVLRGHTRLVRSAAFSPDGAGVVTASDDNTARLWDAATGASRAVLRGHTRLVRSAAFSPDGARIVTASDNNTARLWDAATGELLAVLEGHERPLWSAAFSPDGAWVVTGSDDDTARLWDVAMSTSLAVLHGHTSRIMGAAFSPDGARVVTASEDNTARLWDAATGASPAVLQGHTGSVWSVAFSADGARVVTASEDNTARLWDAATGASLAVLHGHTGSVWSAEFSPDGVRVVTASDDNTARLWNALTGAPLTVLQGHTDSVRSAAFSPDGARVVTASSDSTARLWGAATGVPLAVLQRHRRSVWSAAFSPDGARVVTASNDRTARLWDVATGALLAVLHGHARSVYCAVFSPDGTRVVTASGDNTARLWDAATGASLAVLQGHTRSIYSAAFSPDGARFVTASGDNTARLWDAATGASLAVLREHTRRVRSAAFSPDGTRVVTASSDNTARLWVVWPLLTADTVAYARISALRALSREEQESLYLTEADPATGQKSVIADDPAVVCDRLAGDPFDPHKRAPGVLLDAIDADRAVPACRAAVEAAPDEPRPRYQLGRALYHADQREAAAALIRTAAEKGYPAAQNDLGFRYETGSGLAKDEAEALRLYRQAAEGGYAPAFSNVGRFYWGGIGIGVDRAEAVRWFERGADQGDPFSHRRLAQLYQTGDELPRDLEKALFHRAIAVRLFEAAGDEPAAACARVRRGSLARALPPETAVRIAREVATWRPTGP